MNFSLSTRWNASRHDDGERLIGEIVALGFTTVELGHDLRMGLVPGVRKALSEGIADAASIHHPCPVPVGFEYGGPDVCSPCSTEKWQSEAALRHGRRTVEFAGEIKAAWVVLHGGRVKMPERTIELIRRTRRGQLPGDRSYDKARMRQMLEREKRAGRHLAQLERFLETLLPVAEKAGCGLALEIQPNWESVPTEVELLNLLTRMDTPLLRYWHDFGHGQIRENLGFINHRRWLERLAPFLAGMHVHDVAGTAGDHLAPGQGSLDFSLFSDLAARTGLHVLEPRPQTSVDDLLAGARCLSEQWSPAQGGVGDQGDES